MRCRGGHSHDEGVRRCALPSALPLDSGGDQFTVTGASPRLSWKLVGRAGRVRTNSRHRRRSPRCARDATSTGHRFVRWPWEELRSGQRVQWRVRRSRRGDSEWSDRAGSRRVCSMTTGRLLDLTRRVKRRRVRQAARLPARNRVRADRGVRSARLYATALGVYTATVNGDASGRRNCRPARPRTTARSTRRRQTSPTSLRPGEPARGRAVGRLVPRSGRSIPDAGGMGHDARRARWSFISSTPTVRGRSSAATDLDEQTIDDRPRRSDGWADGRLRRREGGPVTGARRCGPCPRHRLVPGAAGASRRIPRTRRSVRSTPGVWVVDFGQNASGWIRLTDLGPAGPAP